MMFRPWVGKDFGMKTNVLNGVRLLVLGESHYGDTSISAESDPRATTNAVEQLALKENHRFFTALTHVISGKKKSELSAQQLSDVWSSVAFYNYVPVYVANESRIAPTDEMFEAGEKPFRALCEELHPAAILVCGYRLWSWVLKQSEHPPNDPPDTFQVWSIGAALAARMKHPSAIGFSSNEWRPTVTDLLEKCH